MKVCGRSCKFSLMEIYSDLILTESPVNWHIRSIILYLLSRGHENSPRSFRSNFHSSTSHLILMFSLTVRGNIVSPICCSLRNCYRFRDAVTSYLSQSQRFWSSEILSVHHLTNIDQVLRLVLCYSPSHTTFVYITYSFINVQQPEVNRWRQCVYASMSISSKSVLFDRLRPLTLERSSCHFHLAAVTSICQRHSFWTTR